MRHVSMWFLCAALAVAAPALAGTSVGSFTTTLDTLVDGGANQSGITLGDKRYFDFNFSSTGDAPLTADDVDVALSSSADQREYQLRFSFTRDPFDATAGQTTDAVIGYKIEVLGDQFINRAGLRFDATAASGDGLGAASVTDTIRTADGSDLSPAYPGQSQVNIGVSTDGAGGLPDLDEVSIPVYPTRTLEFEKDILVSSRPGGGQVVITTVDNLVEQVPEPGAAALLGAAGALLLARRRRV